MVDVTDDETEDTHYLGKVADRMQGRLGETGRPLRARERVIGPGDGRLLRSKSKLEKMNFRFSPEFKTRLLELAGEDGLTMTAIIERGVKLYEKNRKRGQ